MKADPKTSIGSGSLLRGLLGSIILAVWLCIGISACGDDDLVFPGDIPFPTAAPEATETPDEDEE